MPPYRSFDEYLMANLGKPGFSIQPTAPAPQPQPPAAQDSYGLGYGDSYGANATLYQPAAGQVANSAYPQPEPTLPSPTPPSSAYDRNPYTPSAGQVANDVYPQRVEGGMMDMMAQPVTDNMTWDQVRNSFTEVPSSLPGPSQQLDPAATVDRHWWQPSDVHGQTPTQRDWWQEQLKPVLPELAGGYGDAFMKADPSRDGYEEVGTLGPIQDRYQQHVETADNTIEGLGSAIKNVWDGHYQPGTYDPVTGANATTANQGVAANPQSIMGINDLFNGDRWAEQFSPAENTPGAAYNQLHEQWLAQPWVQAVNDLNDRATQKTEDWASAAYNLADETVGDAARNYVKDEQGRWQDMVAAMDATPVLHPLAEAGRGIVGKFKDEEGWNNPLDLWVNGQQAQKKLTVNSMIDEMYGAGTAENRDTWGDHLSNVVSSPFRMAGGDAFNHWLHSPQGMRAIQEFGVKINPDGTVDASNPDYDAIWDVYMNTQPTLLDRLWQEYQIDPMSATDVVSLAGAPVGAALRGVGLSRLGTGVINVSRAVDTGSVFFLDTIAGKAASKVAGKIGDVMTPEAVKKIRRANALGLEATGVSGMRRNTVATPLVPAAAGGAPGAAISVPFSPGAVRRASATMSSVPPGVAMPASHPAATLLSTTPAAAMPSPAGQPLQNLMNNGFLITPHRVTGTLEPGEEITEVITVVNEETGATYFIEARVPVNADLIDGKVNPDLPVWRPVVETPEGMRYLEYDNMTVDEAGMMIGYHHSEAAFDVGDEGITIDVVDPDVPLHGLDEDPAAGLADALHDPDGSALAEGDVLRLREHRVQQEAQIIEQQLGMVPNRITRNEDGSVVFGVEGGQQVRFVDGEMQISSNGGATWEPWVPESAPLDPPVETNPLPNPLEEQGFTVQRLERSDRASHGHTTSERYAVKKDGQTYLLVAQRSEPSSGFRKNTMFVADPNAPYWQAWVPQEDGSFIKLEKPTGRKRKNMTRAEAENLILDYHSTRGGGGFESASLVHGYRGEDGDRFIAWWNTLTGEEKEAYARGELKPPFAESTIMDRHPGMFPDDGRQFGREADEMERQFEAWWQNASEEERLAMESGEIDFGPDMYPLENLSARQGTASLDDIDTSALDPLTEQRRAEYEAAVQRISAGNGTPEDWHIIYSEDSASWGADPRPKDSGSPDNYWEETLQTLPGGTNEIKQTPPTEEDLLRLQEEMRWTDDESSLNQDRIRMLEEKGANLTEDELQELWELVAKEYGYEGPPVDPKMFMDPNWQQAFLGDVNGTGLGDEQIVDNIWDAAHPEFDSDAIRSSMDNMGLLDAVARLADELPEFEREEVFALLRDKNTNLKQKMQALEEWKQRQDPMTRLKLDEAMRGERTANQNGLAGVGGGLDGGMGPSSPNELIDPIHTWFKYFSEDEAQSWLDSLPREDWIEALRAWGGDDYVNGVLEAEAGVNAQFAERRLDDLETERLRQKQELKETKQLDPMNLPKEGEWPVHNPYPNQVPFLEGKVVPEGGVSGVGVSLDETMPASHYQLRQAILRAGDSTQQREVLGLETWGRNRADHPGQIVEGTYDEAVVDEAALKEWFAKQPDAFKRKVQRILDQGEMETKGRWNPTEPKHGFSSNSAMPPSEEVVHDFPSERELEQLRRHNEALRMVIRRAEEMGIPAGDNGIGVAIKVNDLLGETLGSYNYHTRVISLWVGEIEKRADQLGETADLVLRKTVNEEVFHALRASGAISDDEWAVLVAWAKKNPAMTDDEIALYARAWNEAGPEKYDAFHSLDEHIEDEMVAKAFARRQAALETAGPAARIFEKLRDFVDKMLAAFRSQPSARTVLRDINAGKLAPTWGPRTVDQRINNLVGVKQAEQIQERVKLVRTGKAPRTRGEIAKIVDRGGSTPAPQPAPQPQVQYIPVGGSRTREEVRFEDADYLTTFDKDTNKFIVTRKSDRAQTTVDNDSEFMANPEAVHQRGIQQIADNEAAQEARIEARFDAIRTGPERARSREEILAELLDDTGRDADNRPPNPFRRTTTNSKGKPVDRYFARTEPGHMEPDLPPGDNLESTIESLKQMSVEEFHDPARGGRLLYDLATTPLGGSDSEGRGLAAVFWHKTDRDGTPVGMAWERYKDIVADRLVNPEHRRAMMDQLRVENFTPERMEQLQEIIDLAKERGLTPGELQAAIEGSFPRGNGETARLFTSGEFRYVVKDANGKDLAQPVLVQVVGPYYGNTNSWDKLEVKALPGDYRKLAPRSEFKGIVRDSMLGPREEVLPANAALYDRVGVQEVADAAKAGDIPASATPPPAGFPEHDGAMYMGSHTLPDGTATIMIREEEGSRIYRIIDTNGNVVGEGISPASARRNANANHVAAGHAPAEAPKTTTTWTFHNAKSARDEFGVTLTAKEGWVKLNRLTDDTHQKTGRTLMIKRLPSAKGTHGWNTEAEGFAASYHLKYEHDRIGFIIDVRQVGDGKMEFRTLINERTQQYRGTAMLHRSLGGHATLDEAFDAIENWARRGDSAPGDRRALELVARPVKQDLPPAHALEGGDGVVIEGAAKDTARQLAEATQEVKKLDPTWKVVRRSTESFTIVDKNGKVVGDLFNPGEGDWFSRMREGAPDEAAQIAAQEAEEIIEGARTSATRKGAAKTKKTTTTKAKEKSAKAKKKAAEPEPETEEVAPEPQDIDADGRPLTVVGAAEIAEQDPKMVLIRDHRGKRDVTFYEHRTSATTSTMYAFGRDGKLRAAEDIEFASAMEHDTATDAFRSTHDNAGGNPTFQEPSDVDPEVFKGADAGARRAATSEDSFDYYEEVPDGKVVPGEIYRADSSSALLFNHEVKLIRAKRLKKSAVVRKVDAAGDPFGPELEIKIDELRSTTRKADAPEVEPDRVPVTENTDKMDDIRAKEIERAQKLIALRDDPGAAPGEVENAHRALKSALKNLEMTEAEVAAFESRSIGGGFQSRSIASKGAKPVNSGEIEWWRNPDYNPGAPGGILDSIGHALRRSKGAEFKHRAHGRTAFQDAVDNTLGGDELVTAHKHNRPGTWSHRFGIVMTEESEEAMSAMIKTKRGGERMLGDIVANTEDAAHEAHRLGNKLMRNRAGNPAYKLSKMEQQNLNNALKQIFISPQRNAEEWADFLKMNNDEVSAYVDRLIREEIGISAGILSDAWRPGVAGDKRGAAARAYGAYLNTLRSLYLYGRHRAISYPLQQVVGNSMSGVVARPGALWHYWRPLNFLKTRKRDIEGPASMVKTTADEHRSAAGLGGSATLNPHLGPKNVMRDSLGLNQAPLAWDKAGDLGKAAQKVLIARSAKELGDAGDVAWREAIWMDATAREFYLGKRELINHAKNTAARINRSRGPLIHLTDQQIEKALLDAYAASPTGLISGQDVKRALISAAGPTPVNTVELGNWADRIGRDWTNAVREIDRRGLKEVNRIAFSFENTHFDNILNKFFLFHYWASRATALYATEAIRRPWWGHAFQKYMSEARREYEAHPEKYSKYDAGFWNFWETDAGVKIAGDPISLLRTYLTEPAYIYGLKDDADRSGLGNILNGPSLSIGGTEMPNPVAAMFPVPGLMMVLGAIGALGKDVDVPDAFGIGGHEQSLMRILQTGADIGIPVPGSRGPKGEPKQVAYYSSSDLVKWAMVQLNADFPGIVDKLNYLGPTLQERRTRTFRQAVFGAIYNDPANAGKDSEELELMLADSLADPTDKYYEAGLEATSEKDHIDFVNKLFNPFYTRTEVRGADESRFLNKTAPDGSVPYPTGDGLDAQALGTSGTIGDAETGIIDVRPSAVADQESGIYGIKDLINQDNPGIPDLSMKTDVYYNIVPQDLRDARDTYDGIKYGDGLTQDVFIDGQYYPAQSLQHLSWQERNLLADRWIKQELGPDGVIQLEQAKALQLDLARKDAELADYLGFKKLARDYEGSAEAFINQLARNNPQWQEWILKQPNPSKAYTTQESWEVLNGRGGDLWGPEAQSELGVTPNLTHLGLEDDSLSLGQWFIKEAEGEEKELGEYKQRVVDEVEKAGLLRQAIIEQTGSDDMFQDIVETLARGEKYVVEDDQLYGALKEYMVAGKDGKYYWLGLGAKDYLAWQQQAKAADPQADISVDAYFLESDAEWGREERLDPSATFDPMTQGQELFDGGAAPETAATAGVGVSDKPIMVHTTPDGPKMGMLKTGLRLGVLGQDGDWTKVRLPDGAIGWVETWVLVK